MNGQKCSQPSCVLFFRTFNIRPCEYLDGKVVLLAHFQPWLSFPGEGVRFWILLNEDENGKEQNTVD